MAPEGRLAAGARVVLTVAGLAVAAVLGLKVLVLLLEPRATFFPPPPGDTTPADAGLPFEDLSLQTTDGVRIHAWFIPGVGQAGAGAGARSPITLLAFHGNAEGIEDALPLARLVREAGFNLMLVDYRGYGRSGGRPSERGIYSDGEAALRHLRGRGDIDPARTVLWGRSIGAAVAVHLAAREKVAGVVLESPFTSAPDLLREGGHWLLYGLSLFGTYRLDSASRIGMVTAPVLVVHGTADEIAPFSLGRRLYEMAPGRKEFLAVEGGGHNDLWAFHAETVWGGIRRFLESLP